MHRLKETLLKHLYAWINVLIASVILVGVFVGINRHQIHGSLSAFLELRITLKNVILLDVFVVTWAMVFRFCGLSDPAYGRLTRHDVIRIVRACSFGTVVVVFFSLSTRTGLFTHWVPFYFWIVAMLATLASRYLSGAVVRWLARFGTKRELLIVGTDQRAQKLFAALKQQGYSSVLGFLRSPGGQVAEPEIERRVLGGLDDLETVLVNHAIDEVHIALPVRSCYEEIQRAIHTCERVGVEAKFFFEMFRLSVAKARVEDEAQSPVIALKVVKDDYRMLVKRSIDLVGSSVGLLLLSPVMLAIAVLIKLTSPGQVFFAQLRYGLNRRKFRMYKFRSMVVDAEKLQASLESLNEAKGPVFKIRKDPRITPIGRFLRRTSLDELPQLFSVFKGDMSLVGPRPLPIRDVSRFQESWLMRRFSVKPGITCLWQVNGRSNTQFDKWVELDLQYIDNWSLTLDMKILARTVPVVLAGSGAV